MTIGRLSFLGLKNKMLGQREAASVGGDCRVLPQVSPNVMEGDWLMKPVTFAAVALSLALLACAIVHGPRQEAEAFIAAKDDVIQQWDTTLAANPSEAGVDQARQIFESKRANLIAKQDAIKAKPKGMNNYWELRIQDSDARDRKVLDAIELKVAVNGGDAAREKFKKLREEYEQTVKRWY